MWRFKHVVLLVFVWCLAVACNQHLPLLISDVEQLEPNDLVQTYFNAGSSIRCTDQEAYQPDLDNPDHTPVKYLRVNVHFMNSSDSTHNYNGAEALDFGRKLVSEANKNLVKNRAMWLPYGNSTPLLPQRYLYTMATSKGYEQEGGVYCHYDDDLYWFVSRGTKRNNYDRAVIRKYGIGLDSIINLFVMPHHPDSVKSETYKVTSAGIALGSAVKISGVYETNKEPWAFKGIINHEIGHVMGLRHTWNSNDGCDDTPRNINCWNKTETSPCDTAASNNLMDYNAGQNAWTPCQIGKIQMAMSRENGKARKLLVPTWCTLDSSKTITIADSVSWYGARDLEGHLIIAQGGVLTVHCRLSIPPGGQITVEPGGTLILNGARLHNACGLTWHGINVFDDKRNPAVVVDVGGSRIEDVVSTKR